LDAEPRARTRSPSGWPLGKIRGLWTLEKHFDFMTTEDDGKKIKGIWLSGDGNVLNEHIQSDDNNVLLLDAKYHGYYDEFWIIRQSLTGQEIERFNCRYVSKIEWL